MNSNPAAQNLEDYFKEAEKTMTAFESFSKSTGADITAIQDTSPLPAPSKGETPQERNNLSILSRVVKQAAKDSKSASDVWRKCLPSSAYQHNRVLLNLALDHMAETLTGGRIRHSGRFGEIAADIGAKIAVTTSIDAPALMGENQKPPIFQEMFESSKKGLDEISPYLDDPIGAITQSIHDKGDFQSNKALGVLVWGVQDLMDKVKEPIQSLAAWIDKTTEKITGPELPKSIKKELGVAADWINGLDKTKVAATTAILAFTPNPISPIASLATIALMGQKIFKEAKSWVERNPTQSQENEISKRADAMTTQHGERFDPENPFWKEKIEKELAEVGLRIAPPPVLEQKPPTNRILIVGELHSQHQNNFDAYAQLIPELAKKGFKTLTIERPKDESKETWDAWTKETENLNDEDALKQIGTEKNHWVGAYCLAKRHGMNVEFIDHAEKEGERMLNLYKTCQAELPATGKGFDPEKATSVYGGPHQYLLYQKNGENYAHARDLKMAEKIADLSKKGPVAHIGGVGHNQNLQEEISKITGSRPKSLIFEYTDRKAADLTNINAKTTNTEKVPTQTIGQWDSELPNLQKQGIKKTNPKQAFEIMPCHP